MFTVQSQKNVSKSLAKVINPVNARLRKVLTAEEIRCVFDDIWW